MSTTRPTRKPRRCIDCGERHPRLFHAYGGGFRCPLCHELKERE